MPHPAFIPVTPTQFLPHPRITQRFNPLPLPLSLRRVPLPKARTPPTAALHSTLLAATTALATFFHHPGIPLPTPTPPAHDAPLTHVARPAPRVQTPSLPVLALTPVPTVPPAVAVAKAVLPGSIDAPVRFVVKVLLLVAVAVVVVTAVTVGVFWIIQDSLVYKPTKVWRGSPRASGMPFYDDVSYCTVDGVEISGWFIRQPGERFRRARTLVYFHGTDKNASFRLKKAIGFYETCGCNVLLLSYRGYGLSTGKPNERGVRIDAESAYHYLKSRGDVDVGPGGNLWVYGESLGGAVAIHFSNVYQHCINALILENTFTSLLDMIKLEFPILGVFRYLSRNRWQSKKKIGDLGIPLLFLSGLKDSYIPPQMMKTMHMLATKSPLKEFVEFEKGTHNRTWTLDGFYETVARFMDKVEGEFRSDDKADTQESVSGGGFDDGRLAAA